MESLKLGPIRDERQLMIDAIVGCIRMIENPPPDKWRDVVLKPLLKIADQLQALPRSD